MGQIWRDFGHAFSFASSSSRGIYPSPSYLIFDSVLHILPQDAVYYFCKASIPRAMPEQQLAQKARQAGLQGEYYPTVAAAYEAARQAASSEDMIYIGGSTFVVAEVI